MSANPSNTGTVIGRLAADPKVFYNQDGSRSISFSVFASNNFTNREGERTSNVVPLTQYYSATKEGNGLYPYLGEGDQVAVTYNVRQDTFTNKAGEVEYKIVLDVESIQGLETKNVVDSRRARKQATQAQQAPAQQFQQTPVQQFQPAPQQAPVQQYATTAYAGNPYTAAAYPAQAAMAPQVNVDPRFM